MNARPRVLGACTPTLGSSLHHIRGTTARQIAAKFSRKPLHKKLCGSQCVYSTIRKWGRQPTVTTEQHLRKLVWYSGDRWVLMVFTLCQLNILICGEHHHTIIWVRDFVANNGRSILSCIVRRKGFYYNQISKTFIQLFWNYTLYSLSRKTSTHGVKLRCYDKNFSVLAFDSNTFLALKSTKITQIELQSTSLGLN